MSMFSIRFTCLFFRLFVCLFVCVPFYLKENWWLSCAPKRNNKIWFLNNSCLVLTKITAGSFRIINPQCAIITFRWRIHAESGNFQQPILMIPKLTEVLLFKSRFCLDFFKISLLLWMDLVHLIILIMPKFTKSLKNSIKNQRQF